jgi:hypothetical protein
MNTVSNYFLNDKKKAKFITINFFHNNQFIYKQYQHTARWTQFQIYFLNDKKKANDITIDFPKLEEFELFQTKWRQVRTLLTGIW